MQNQWTVRLRWHHLSLPRRSSTRPRWSTNPKVTVFLSSQFQFVTYPVQLISPLFLRVRSKSFHSIPRVSWTQVHFGFCPLCFLLGHGQARLCESFKDHIRAIPRYSKHEWARQLLHVALRCFGFIPPLPVTIVNELQSKPLL